ncbi:MAG: RNA polymerase sigma factor [Acidimicrobiia bacterium]
MGGRPLPAPSSLSELVELAEEHRQVRRALMSLRPDERLLLWLRYVEGLSYEQLAQAAGRSQGATRVAVHRARRRLAGAIAEAGGERSRYPGTFRSHGSGQA